MNALSLIDFLLERLESESPQHPSSWPEEQALNICAEAVDLLKSRMKKEGHIDSLPSWIKESDFIKQYEDAYPGEPLAMGDNRERIFELPTQLDENSVVKVMDNIRYFGIIDNQKSPLVKRLFEFYVKKSNRHHIEPHKLRFPELKALWDNVKFTVPTELMNKSFIPLAASQNLLIAMQYAHENGFPWDANTCASAARAGHLDCLKYAHENKCPWNEKTCASAARGDHLDCLKYANENKCPWDEETCYIAAEEGHIQCLKYAHEHKCTWSMKTTYYAASEGQLKCLEFAHKNGCPWDTWTCSGAADGGHLDCLKYAHENGCPWSQRVCADAASAGHLDCLKYAHENDCPWNKKTSSGAIRGGHLDCLKYAHENGCPG